MIINQPRFWSLFIMLGISNNKTKASAVFTVEFNGNKMNLHSLILRLMHCHIFGPKVLLKLHDLKSRNKCIQVWMDIFLSGVSASPVVSPLLLLAAVGAGPGTHSNRAGCVRRAPTERSLMPPRPCISQSQSGFRNRICEYLSNEMKLYAGSKNKTAFPYAAFLLSCFFVLFFSSLFLVFFSL